MAGEGDNGREAVTGMVRRSAAEPDHVLFGVPSVTYLAVALFPLGTALVIVGVKAGFGFGFAATCLIHLVSVILRRRFPYTENVIWYWFNKRRLADAFRRRVHVYFA